MTPPNALVPASANSEVIFGKKFTAFEAEVLRDVLRPDTSASLIIPDNIDPEKLWSSLDVTCRVVGTLKEAADKLKPMMGRMLVILEHYPEILRLKGYDSYEEFMTKGMPEKFGISRSEAYHCKRIALCFPSLTTDEFREIGVSKLQKLAMVTKEGDKDCDRLLEMAKTHTVAEVVQEVTRLRHMVDGEMELTTVAVLMTVDVARQWKEFHSDPAIQAFCETTYPGVILGRMIEECGTEWRTQGEYIMAGGR